MRNCVGSLIRAAAITFVMGSQAGQAIADDNTEANTLFVEAMLAWDDAALASDEMERLRLIELVEANLQQIIVAHPGSDLAVKLVIGEAIGPLSMPVVRAALSEAEAVAAVAQAWTDCISAPNPRCIMAEVDRLSQSIPEAQDDDVIVSNAILVAAASGQLDTAIAMTAGLGGYFLDRAFRDIAIAQANAGKMTEAHETVDRIANFSTRIRTLIAIAKAEFALSLPDQARATLMGAYKETGSATDPGERHRLRNDLIWKMAELGLAQDARTLALAIEEVDDRDEHLLRIVRAQTVEGSIDAAIETAALIEGTDSLDRAQGNIAVAEAKAGLSARALERANGITDATERLLTLAEVATGLAENGETALAETTLADAVALAEEQGDDSWFRFNFFRYVGTAQAKLGQTDAAIPSFDKATAAAIDLGEGDFRNMALAFVAEDLSKAGLVDRARGVIGQARDFARALQADDHQKVNALTQVAFAADRIGQDDLATAVLQLAIEAAQERADPLDRIADLSDIAGQMSLPDN